jgi:hypothetical protein
VFNLKIKLNIKCCHRSVEQLVVNKKLESASVLFRLDCAEPITHFPEEVRLDEPLCLLSEIPLLKVVYYRDVVYFFLLSKAVLFSKDIHEPFLRFQIFVIDINLINLVQECGAPLDLRIFEAHVNSTSLRVSPTVRFYARFPLWQEFDSQEHTVVHKVLAH